MGENKKPKICTCSSPPEVSPPEDDPEIIALARQKARQIYARLCGIPMQLLDEDVVVGEKMIVVPNSRISALIGIENRSGGKIQIQVSRDINDPNSGFRSVKLTGTPLQIRLAELAVFADKRVAIMVPDDKIGLVIGKRGETIRNIQATTGARLEVISWHLPPGDTSTKRQLEIVGTDDQVEAAKQFVNGVISENPLRNPTMRGYPQQAYQAQPPTSWPQGGAAMQQPPYYYVQPGAYLGENPQYNSGQAPYPGYPPQPITGGYGDGWDQTSAPQNHQTSQGAVYGYYNQQPTAQQAPGENSSYGYIQEGYVAALHPIPNPTIPSQGATWHAMPSSSQSAYGSQPPTGYGSGYGTLQAQKPPANQPPYGQAQQSLSAQGRYPQYASAYPPHAQSGYA